MDYYIHANMYATFPFLMHSHCSLSYTLISFPFFILFSPDSDLLCNYQNWNMSKNLKTCRPYT